jgi:hypothetical protein
VRANRIPPRFTALALPSSCLLYSLCCDLILAPSRRGSISVGPPEDYTAGAAAAAAGGTDPAKMALSRSFHTTRGSRAGVHTLPLPTSGGTSQRGSNAKPGDSASMARLQAHLSSPDLHDVSKQALATDGGTSSGGGGGRAVEDERVYGSMLTRPDGTSSSSLRIPLEELQRDGSAGPSGLFSGRDSSRGGVGSVIPMIPKIDLRNAQPDTLGHKRSQSRSGRRLSSMSTSLSSRVDPGLKVSIYRLASLSFC